MWDRKRSGPSQERSEEEVDTLRHNNKQVRGRRNSSNQICRTRRWEKRTNAHNLSRKNWSALTRWEVRNNRKSGFLMTKMKTLKNKRTLPKNKRADKTTVEELSYSQTSRKIYCFQSATIKASTTLEATIHHESRLSGQWLLLSKVLLII